MPNPPKKRRTGSASAAGATSPSAAGSSKNESNTMGPSKRASTLHSALQASTTLLLDVLDEVESSSKSDLPPLLSKSASHLLEIRRAQRELSLAVERDLQGAVAKRRAETESEGLALQNLMYERDYLRGQIRACREFECGELTKMARDEIGSDAEEEGEEERGGNGGGGGVADDDKEEVESKKSDASATASKKGGSSSKGGDSDDEDGDSHGEESDRKGRDEAAVDSFLGRKDEFDGGAGKAKDDGDAEMKDAEANAVDDGAEDILEGYSHRDPSNHARNLSRLQSEITARSALVRELQSARSELTSARRRLDDARSFLDNLPRKLSELERSSMPLQNFFLRAGRQRARALAAAADSGKGTNQKQQPTPKSRKRAPLLTGTERAERLDAAMGLSGPMYALFVQLQSFIDAAASIEGDDDIGGALKLDVNKTSEGRGRKVGPASAARFSVASSNATESDDDSDADGGFDLERALTSDGSSVSLGLPVLDAGSNNSSSSSGAYVTVTFRYLPVLNVITAEATGGDGRLEPDGVLAELFPGDGGTELPNDAVAALLSLNFGKKRGHEDEEGACDDHDGDDDKDESVTDEKKEENESVLIDRIRSALSSRKDRPYRWAQYIAGLHFPPSSSDNKGRENRIEPCTDAVVRQLTRRVRARAALNGIASALGRAAGRRGGGSVKDLPAHPAYLEMIKKEEEEWGEDGLAEEMITAKVISWSEARGEPFASASAASTGGADFYAATVKRGSASLTATVRLGPAYPAEPPVWSLQPVTASLLLGDAPSSSSWGEKHGSVGSLHPNNASEEATADGGAAPKQPPLYDPALGRIESAVNGVDAACRLVLEGNEETYDYLLAHQLREVARLWDASERCSEEEDTKAGLGGGSGSSSGRGGRGGGSVVSTTAAFGGVKARRGRDRMPVAWGAALGSADGVGFGAYSEGV